MTYATFEQAAARAAVLTRESGIWPGIVACAGGYRLTCDPDMRGPGR